MDELRAEGVRVSYGDLVAVRDVDLVVHPGQLISVTGPSGAGKSSLVRAGLIPLLRRTGWTIIGPVTPSQGVVPDVEGPGRRLVVLDQAE